MYGFVIGGVVIQAGNDDRQFRRGYFEDLRGRDLNGISYNHQQEKTLNNNQASNAPVHE